MAPHDGRRFQQGLRQAASTVGVVALSVLTTVLVQRGLAPPTATGQSISSGEIRAQAFVLTAPDGTVIGRLGPGSSGNGNLTLFDSDGRLHLALSGSGNVLAYGTGGTALAQIYADPDSNASGLLLRDADGNLRMVAAQGPDSAAVNVRDPDGKLRVGIGTLASADGSSTSDYGLRVRDPEGNILLTQP
jgi:hypothetical protein